MSDTHEPTGLENTEAKIAQAQEAGVIGHTTGGEIAVPGGVPADQPSEEVLAAAAEADPTPEPEVEVEVEEDPSESVEDTGYGDPEPESTSPDGDVLAEAVAAQSVEPEVLPEGVQTGIAQAEAGEVVDRGPQALPSEPDTATGDSTATE